MHYGILLQEHFVLIIELHFLGVYVSQNTGLH